MPVLEDDLTIQLALSDVVNAMLCDRIDTRKAALALYALQTAAANLKNAEMPKGNFYREYVPELDASMPDLPPSPPEQITLAPSATIEPVPAKIPPKKPVASAPEKVSKRMEVFELLRKSTRAEAKAIRRYTRAFNAGTAEPLPWVLKKHEEGEYLDE
jgi:hypothetical protein